jgi:branched-chain amino acid transport system permease protein
MASILKSKFNLRDKFGDWWEKSTRNQRIAFRVIVIGTIYALPFLDNPLIGTPETSFKYILFNPIALFTLMAVGLNIVVGKSGILDLGYVAFFAIGAYTFAILGTRTSLNFYEILPLSMGFAMLAGFILGLPALRTRGDYLAIITLGFGEIVRIIAINLDSIGGALGIAGIPAPPTTFGFEFVVDNPVPYYWLTISFLFLVIWAFLRLTKRKPGRAWEAIREDEDVAEFMGVETTKYKLWAFVIGGAVGGASGAIYASQVASIEPASFTLNFSILILAFVVFGGMGNIWGVIAGSVLLAYLPEKLRFLSDIRIVVFGALMVLMMNDRPDGLIPRKKREKVYDKTSGQEVSR